MTRVKRIDIRAIDLPPQRRRRHRLRRGASSDEERAPRRPQGRKVGIVPEPGSCAVLDIAKLAAGDIDFGSNSWRGDEYEPHLREAIEKFTKSEA